MKRIQRLQTIIYGVLSFAMVGILSLNACAKDRDKDKSESKTTVTAERGSGVKVSISNFGQVNERYFRGAQPKAAQYQELARLGVKTIVDLRDDAEPFAKRAAEAAGLRYLNFPLDDKSYPAADAATRFLDIANNEANWPIYVHCAGGRHRTGAMTAVYRMTNDGWDINKAYREMKDYDFYTAWGHGDLKDYVYNYSRDLKRNPVMTAASPQVIDLKSEALSTQDKDSQNKQ